MAITAGSGATAVVQVARCLKNNMKVAIKRIDLERCGSTIEELQVSTCTSQLLALMLPLGQEVIISYTCTCTCIHFYSIEVCPRGHPSILYT